METNFQYDRDTIVNDILTTIKKDYGCSYTPKTSWENIADNYVNEFECYCQDEASNFLIDDISDSEEFFYQCEVFCQFLDIEDYDFGA